MASEQRQNLQVTCQSKQHVTYSSKSPQAAGPVLMAGSQDQSVDLFKDHTDDASALVQVATPLQASRNLAHKWARCLPLAGLGQ